ncbi:MAG: hypothetical protein LC687_04710 [Actinobacteria bacterium]|nr:hypothetical protein [Actinomycetota bacterium]
MRTKNFIALLAMIGLSYWSTILFDASELSQPGEVYWTTLLYVAAGSILYVLIGFDLYDRFNSWSDKKFGPPKPPKADPPPKKKKTP